MNYFYQHQNHHHHQDPIESYSNFLSRMINLDSFVLQQLHIKEELKEGIMKY